MRTDISEYWKQGLDREHRELLVGGVSAKAGGSSSDRLAEIERVMKSDIDSYFRQGLDREHAALTAASSVDPADEPLLDDLSRSREGQKLAARWNHTGNTAEIIGDLRETALALKAEGGDDVIDGFDMLPDRVRVNALAAVTTPMPMVTPSADAVARFKAEPVGAKLMAEWGKDAPARIGRVQARAARIFGGLTVPERQEARAFIDGLTPAAVSAVVRRLAE